MQFHNSTVRQYHVPMFATTPGTLLARLRSSARLAVLMLLVFALKIGTVAACAQHDFADMGLGSGGDHSLVVSDVQGSDDPSIPLTSHAGACSHCSSHHAAALTTTLTAFVVTTRRGLEASSSGLPSSARPSLELRPPIA